MRAFLLLLLIHVLLPLSAAELGKAELRLQQLERSVEVLSRQLMMMQMSQEEARRSDGDSGIKQVRLNRDGTRTYHSSTHTGTSVAAIHEHANMPSTCGMGEIEAVLNGVHFRTRHNDYMLRMPADTGEYDATVDIPFPAVPPTVVKKKIVEEQVAEMREWFRAWKDGDTKHRNYRPYFKPLLCYLEGAWTTDKAMAEPFLSDRHRLDALDWADLQEKVRFTAYTGDKNPEENFAFLPTMLLNVTNGVPSTAQWNYRILCHPVKHDLHPRDLKPVDDLSARLAQKDTMEDYVNSRAARFTLNPFSGEKIFKWTEIDKIMKQIPGKNNYGGRITDKMLGGVKLHAHNNRPLNTAYYHRWYKTTRAGAMGERVSHRGFADRNLFVAETTQPRVAPMAFKTCRTFASGRRSCATHIKRVSYAIPLEIVFLTPLHAWNPYDLEYKGENLSELGRTVVANGRKGKRTAESAYNGTNSRHYYQTPATFFSGSEVDSDPADTVRGVVGVLGQKGKVRSVVASGVRIFMPEIKGVGVLRTRYPIMPVYAEGSVIWKELEALRDIVLNMQEHTKYFYKTPNFLDQDVKLTEKKNKKPVNKGTDKNKKTENEDGGERENTANRGKEASNANENRTSKDGERKTGTNKDSKADKDQKVKKGSEAGDSKEADSLDSNATGEVTQTVPIRSGSKGMGTQRKAKNTSTHKPAALSPAPNEHTLFLYDNSSSLASKSPAFSNMIPSNMMGYHPYDAFSSSNMVTLITSPSTRTYVTMHVHTVQLSRQQVRALRKHGKKVTVRTTLEGGHSHLVTIRFDSTTQYFYIELCDGRAKCWDGHSRNLEKISNSLMSGLRGFG